MITLADIFHLKGAINAQYKTSYQGELKTSWIPSLHIIKKTKKEEHGLNLISKGR